MAHGFDYFYGHLGGWIDYFTHERNGVLDWQRRRSAVREEGYSTDLLCADAVRIIEEHASEEQPLFLLLSLNAPHTPLHVAPSRATAASPRELFRGIVEHMDAGIGRVVDALDRTGHRHNTLLFFLSDNGGAPLFGGDNGPLVGGKYTVNEGGIRVPAILSWPAAVPSGGRSSQLMTNLDVLPTLCRAAGLTEPPQLDGRDVLDELISDGTVPRDDLFFFVRHHRLLLSAVVRNDFKFIRTRPNEGLVRERLFNVATDPGEQHDLADRLPELAEELAAQLSRHEHDVLAAAER